MTGTGPKRTLRIWQVKEKTGLSEATVWRLSASFPKPIKLSKGCTVWLEHEIDDLLDSKAAERQPVTPAVQCADAGSDNAKGASA